MAYKKKQPSIQKLMKYGKIELWCEVRKRAYVSIKPKPEDISLLDDYLRSNELIDLNHLVNKCVEMEILDIPNFFDYRFDATSTYLEIYNRKIINQIESIKSFGKED